MTRITSASRPPEAASAYDAGAASLAWRLLPWLRPGRDWGQWLTLMVTGYLGLYLLWQVFRWGGDEYKLLIGGLIDLPVYLVGALLAWRASASVALEGRSRRAWRFLSLAQLSFATGNVLWCHYEAILHVPPTPSLADAAYLSFYPLLLTGLLSFPRAFRSPSERARFWLDVTIVLVGCAMVILHFVLPRVEADGEDLLASTIAYGYVVGDLVLLLGVITLLLRGHQGATGRVIQLLSVSVGVTFVGDLLFAQLLDDQAYSGGDLLDVTWIVAEYLLVLAAKIQYRGRCAPSAASDGQEQRHLAWLPYAAIGAGYGLLLAVSFGEATEALQLLVIGALVLTVLEVARQVLAVRENGRLLAEVEARRVEARFRSLVQNASDAVVVIDPDTAIVYQTPSVERIFGYAPEDSLGARVLAWIHPDDAPRAQVYLARSSEATSAAATAEWRMRRKDGSWLHTETTTTNLVDDPNVRGVVLTIRDITERKALEEQLAHQAFHDPLTGLASRALFRDRVEHALMRQSRAGTSVVVLFLDLDDFKTVNDSLGHAVGDQLLVTVARRLRESLQSGDTAARLGGDEFAVLLEQPTRLAEAGEVAQRILAVLRAPIRLSGHELILNASVGIASSAAGDGADELLRNADVAMYTVKTHGKGGWTTFHPDMHRAAVQRLALKADLQRAVEQEEFEVYYQPTVAIASGQIVGAEALVRWIHPQRGIVPPAEFIPLAEETGLIVPIGRSVLRAACRQARAWQVALPAGQAFKISANLSARQLQDPALLEDVAAALRDSGLPPGSLVLEITESMLMQDVEDAIARLTALKGLGLQIAIDDFGTGYSSLAYLRRFPVDILKIDRAFIRDLARGVTDVALTNAIVELGRALALQLVAEGIEEADQREHLIGMGCQLGQGYLWAKPLPADRFASLLGVETVSGVPATVPPPPPRAREETAA